MTFVAVTYTEKNLNIIKNSVKEEKNIKFEIFNYVTDNKIVILAYRNCRSMHRELSRI